MSYQLTDDPDRVIRLEDGAVIPLGHRWWDEYENWRAAGGIPIPNAAPETLETLRTALRAAATQRRWECETGGITIGGVQVGTSTEDQNRISTVLAAADLGTVEQVDFKAISGWVTLTLAEIRGIAAAISAHVQACFTAERAHHEAIGAMTSIEELRAYDVATGWSA
ncbi:DUF4376 domain-containing protein [Xanthomonas sp. NCPPB 1062]|uniref:DUF4376 domain-containing protein n=1 Tax=Xanthomonas sp. NCPPB 1062 TaxID=487523 RepID=UPI003558742E